MFMGKQCQFGWPVYSVFDEVKDFDGDIELFFILSVCNSCIDFFILDDYRFIRF